MEHERDIEEGSSLLFGMAMKLFQSNEGAARKWLYEPNQALGGVAPIDASYEEVEALVERVERGIVR